MDRRVFLRDATLAGLAAGGALCPGRGLFAQGAINHPGRIDVHHHYMPPFQERVLCPWSAQIALEAMDRNNVATAILSGVTFPEPLNDGTEAARSLARQANEFAASMVQDHPGRFGFLRPYLWRTPTEASARSNSPLIPWTPTGSASLRAIPICWAVRVGWAMRPTHRCGRS